MAFFADNQLVSCFIFCSGAINHEVLKKNEKTKILKFSALIFSLFFLIQDTSLLQIFGLMPL